MMHNILIILSAADTWMRADGSKYPSGVWAEELVVMDERLVAAGCTVDIATPGGVAPTIDPHSMDPAVVGQAQVDHFRANLDGIAARLAHPLVLAEVETARYEPSWSPADTGRWRISTRTPRWGASWPRRTVRARSSRRCAMARPRYSPPGTRAGNGRSPAAA
jgi:hypothetical protein